MPKKILLADDSITIQKVVGITFANEDIELTVVDNGTDAVTKAKEIAPDLVLADVVMPGKDGYQVCQEIKADPSLSGVPVVLLAGTFEPFDEAKSKESGADDHITKPFESQALLDMVRAQLAKAPATPAEAAAPVAPPAPETAAAPVEATAGEAADDVWDMSEEMVAETPAAPVAAAPVAAAPEVEDDVWGDDDFGDLGEIAEEAASAVPEAVEEAVASDEELWGDMDLGGGEEVAVEAPAAAGGGDEFDFGDDAFTEEGAFEETAPAAEEEDFFDLAEEPEPAPAAAEAPPVAAAPEPTPAPAVEAVAEPPAPVAPAATPQAAPAAGGLSEAEMEAVVSKVAREIIEKIAWEVVPELAETLIKEEIRKLKGV